MRDAPRAMGLLKSTLVWVAAFAVTILAFYGLDHLVMSGQGLPLNLDLTPVQ